jgi:hypothetical protein
MLICRVVIQFKAVYAVVAVSTAGAYQSLACALLVTLLNGLCHELQHVMLCAVDDVAIVSLANGIAV